MQFLQIVGCWRCEEEVDRHTTFCDHWRRKSQCLDLTASSLRFGPRFHTKWFHQIYFGLWTSHIRGEVEHCKAQQFWLRWPPIGHQKKRQYLEKGIVNSRKNYIEAVFSFRLLEKGLGVLKAASNKMEWLFGKKKTPEQMLRQHQRTLNRAIR